MKSEHIAKLRKTFGPVSVGLIAAQEAWVDYAGVCDDDCKDHCFNATLTKMREDILGVLQLCDECEEDNNP